MIESGASLRSKTAAVHFRCSCGTAQRTEARPVGQLECEQVVSQRLERRPSMAIQ